MCHYDYDQPDFYLATTQRARKEHKCYECGRSIQVGERYIRTTGKWDGHCSQYKHCAHCQVMLDWLKRECGGWVHGGLEEDVEGHIAEYGVPVVGFGLARMYVNMRENWMRDGALLPVPVLPSKRLHVERAHG